jgi:hypothetical protein
VAGAIRNRAKLTRVLHDLWTRAFYLGVDEVSDILGVPPKEPFGIDALLEAEGPGWIDQILSVTADIANRPMMIVITEISRAFNAGIVAMYRANGNTLFRWETTSPIPCPICVRNSEDTPRFYGAPYSSGAIDPPQHPNCECILTGVV